MNKTLSILFLISISIFYSCSSGKVTTAGEVPNSLTQKEKNSGWVLLFDGQTMNGWHTYNKSDVSKNWSIEDGALVMTPPSKKGDRGDIITNEEYENYEFSTEWKISEGGNSGIIFNVKEDPEYPNTYTTGPEMQVLDNIKAADNKKENHLAGLLYDLSGNAELSKPKPIGEWNKARIIQKNGHLTFYFNGIKTVDIQQGSTEWKNMITNSKFKDWPDFATSPKGKIAFQDHGHKVAFRNIKIRKL